MLHKAWNSKGEVPYCFPKSSIKFQGHTGQNIIAFDPNWAFPDYRPVAAFKSLRFALLLIIPTVGTPYNTTPYITGSNIALLGHGSQNLWSKLWIPIVKSAPVRVIFTWKSVPKKSIHGSSDIYLGTQLEAEAQLPVVLPFRCHCHLPLIWHNRHYMTPWSSIRGQEGLIDANCICLRFTGTWAHRHRHPVDSCLQARWTRSVLLK